MDESQMWSKVNNIQDLLERRFGNSWIACRHEWGVGIYNADQKTYGFNVTIFKDKNSILKCSITSTVMRQEKAKSGLSPEKNLLHINNNGRRTCFRLCLKKTYYLKTIFMLQDNYLRDMASKLDTLENDIQYVRKFLLTPKRRVVFF